jgi:ATP-dependent Clp protease, protease subunit
MSEINVLIPSAEENLQLPSPTLLAYYRDLENRVIWIDDDIDSRSLEIIKQILSWNQEDSKKRLSIERRKPIKIMFYSYGGDLDVNFALVDAISLSMTPVYGYNMGVACSAAALIYLACHKRFCLPSAYFVFHRGSVETVPQNYNEFFAMVNDYQMRVEKFVEYIEEQTEIPHEVLLKEINNDWYVGATDALKWKICDEVVTSLDQINE